MFDGFVCVTITNSGFLLHYLTYSHFPCSLIPANSVLCSANVLLILHLMLSVTQPSQRALKAVQKVSAVSQFHFAPQETLHFLCSKKKKKKKAGNQCRGYSFCFCFIFVHFPEAVCSCTAQGKCCGVASAKGNVYSDGLKCWEM